MPDYFDAKIRPDKLKFCIARIGGYSSRTKCIEDVPSVIEVSKDQTSIDIFPDNPIPVDKNNYNRCDAWFACILSCNSDLILY